MQKRDLPCFFLSLLVSLLVLYFLALTNKTEPIEQEELKIGLVNLENNFVLDSDGKAKTDAAPKESDSSLDEKKTLEEKHSEQKEELKEEVKEKESPKEKKQEELLPEEKEGEIQKEKAKEEKKQEEKKTTEVEKPKKPSLEDLKKQISKPKLDKQLTNMDNFHKNNSKESGIGLDVDRILSKANGPIGLPSGSRVGTADGTAIVDWSPSNQEPSFPESARKSGKNGSVVLIVLVDEGGNVLSVKMERGSGVPEINAAIEKVARTWKVKLLKKGQSVGGTFVLKYSFRLQ